jgi:hypothetical protein
VVAAVVTGVAAESVWHQVGVVAVGAAFGAFWGMSQLVRSGFWTSIWHMGARFGFSFCLCWIPAGMVETWLADHKWGVPANAALLALSFIGASPREFAREVTPLVRWWRRERKE